MDKSGNEAVITSNSNKTNSDPQKSIRSNLRRKLLSNNDRRDADEFKSHADTIANENDKILGSLINEDESKHKKTDLQQTTRSNRNVAENRDGLKNKNSLSNRKIKQEKDLQQHNDNGFQKKSDEKEIKELISSILNDQDTNKDRKSKRRLLLNHTNDEINKMKNDEATLNEITNQQSSVTLMNNNEDLPVVTNFKQKNNDARVQILRAESNSAGLSNQKPHEKIPDNQTLVPDSNIEDLEIGKKDSQSLKNGDSDQIKDSITNNKESLYDSKKNSADKNLNYVEDNKYIQKLYPSEDGNSNNLNESGNQGLKSKVNDLCKKEHHNEVTDQRGLDALNNIIIDSDVENTSKEDIEEIVNLQTSNVKSIHKFNIQSVKDISSTNKGSEYKNYVKQKSLNRKAHSCKLIDVSTNKDDEKPTKGRVNQYDENIVFDIDRKSYSNIKKSGAENESESNPTKNQKSRVRGASSNLRQYNSQIITKSFFLKQVNGLENSANSIKPQKNLLFRFRTMEMDDFKHYVKEYQTEPFLKAAEDNHDKADSLIEESKQISNSQPKHDIQKSSYSEDSESEYLFIPIKIVKLTNKMIKHDHFANKHRKTKDETAAYDPNSKINEQNNYHLNMMDKYSSRKSLKIFDGEYIKSYKTLDNIEIRSLNDSSLKKAHEKKKRDGKSTSKDKYTLNDVNGVDPENKFKVKQNASGQELDRQNEGTINQVTHHDKKVANFTLDSEASSIIHSFKTKQNLNKSKIPEKLEEIEAVKGNTDSAFLNNDAKYEDNKMTAEQNNDDALAYTNDLLNPEQYKSNHDKFKKCLSNYAIENDISVDSANLNSVNDQDEPLGPDFDEKFDIDYNQVEDAKIIRVKSQRNHLLHESKDNIKPSIYSKNINSISNSPNPKKIENDYDAQFVTKPANILNRTKDSQYSSKRSIDAKLNQSHFINKSQRSIENDKKQKGLQKVNVDIKINPKNVNGVISNDQKDKNPGHQEDDNGEHPLYRSKTPRRDLRDKSIDNNKSKSNLRDSRNNIVKNRNELTITQETSRSKIYHEVEGPQPARDNSKDYEPKRLKIARSNKNFEINENLQNLTLNKSEFVDLDLKEYLLGNDSESLDNQTEALRNKIERVKDVNRKLIRENLELKDNIEKVGSSHFQMENRVQMIKEKLKIVEPSSMRLNNKHEEYNKKLERMEKEVMREQMKTGGIFQRIVHLNKQHTKIRIQDLQEIEHIRSQCTIEQETSKSVKILEASQTIPVEYTRYE